MNSNLRWMVFVGALLLAAMVGITAWQAGVAHGIEQSGKIVVAAPAAAGPYPYPYPYYGWHRPWGFGFLFIPIFFAFWFVVARSLFWRRRAWYGGGCGGPYGCFEEWHRQAHARGEGEPAPPSSGER